MPNDNVQTLTGHPVLDAPVRNAQAQHSEASNACLQEVQSSNWKRPEDIAPRQQNGDITTQLSQGATGKMGESKCGGLPNLQIDGLDSNMGPFDPDFGRFDRDINYKQEKGGCPQFEPRELHGVPGYGDKPDFPVKRELGKSDLLKKHFEKDDFKTGQMKDKIDGSKCGGSDMVHPETHTTQRRMTESERIIEQKLIDQKIREMKLRERYRL